MADAIHVMYRFLGPKSTIQDLLRNDVVLSPLLTLYGNLAVAEVVQVSCAIRRLWRNHGVPLWIPQQIAPAMRLAHSLHLGSSIAAVRGVGGRPTLLSNTETFAQLVILSRLVDRYADVVGTVDEQVGRFRALADAGVDEVFVALHEDGTTEQVERFGEVIAAFR